MTDSTDSIATHPNTEEERALQAALYTLGALPESAARAFRRHLESGCASCQAEVSSYQGVVEKLGFSAPRVAPPAGLRDRLFAELAKSSAPKAAPSPAKAAGREGAKTALGRSLTIRANEGKWVEMWDGVFVKRLFTDKDKGTVTTLFKLLPGASIPQHRHLAAEECLVLEGDYHINGEVLGAGDYHCALPDSVDESLYTVGGAMFLLVSPEHYASL